jgi:hypothetical protein
MASAKSLLAPGRSIKALPGAPAFRGREWAAFLLRKGLKHFQQVGLQMFATLKEMIPVSREN